MKLYLIVIDVIFPTQTLPRTDLIPDESQCHKTPNQRNLDQI